jgi:hypothetical protein
VEINAMHDLPGLILAASGAVGTLERVHAASMARAAAADR